MEMWMYFKETVDSYEEEEELDSVSKMLHIMRRHKNPHISIYVMIHIVLIFLAT